MQVVERHGGTSHYVRPDRVYRTGVLAPVIGYQPGMDAQAVAAEFTQYPMDLQTNGLAGLHGPGWIGKLRSWFARRGAPRAMAPMIPPGMDAAKVFDPRYMPGGTYAQVGEQYSPQMLSKEQMIAHLIGGNLPPPYAKAQGATSYQHWANRWWNG